MIRRKGLAAFALLGLTLTSLAGQAKKPLIDPFPLRFPLVEAGSLEIEGHVVGQPQAYHGMVYFAIRAGCLMAVGAPSGGVLWWFQADHSISSSPMLSGDFVLIRDDGGVFYGINRTTGALFYKTAIPAAVTDAVGIFDGGTFLGTADGGFLCLDPGGGIGGAYRPPGPQAKITAGPAPVFDKDAWLDFLLFGYEDGRLMAVEPKGRPAWEFRARGAIQPGLGQFGKNVFFGDSERMFYCLDGATGKKVWSRRLQGAVLHPTVVRDGIVAVAASNSVVYRLSAGGGSILSWEAIPSRIIYEPAAAGSLALLTWAGPTLIALDLPSGKRAGQYQVSGVLAAGAVWSPPYVVLFEEDAASGRQRIVFLRSR
jgi:outer membrane protein assembly factor BamB